MGFYSYKKHKRSKYSKKNKYHTRRKTRKMGGGGGGSGGMGVNVISGSDSRYINPINTSQIAGCSSDNRTGVGSYYLNTPRAVGGQSGGGSVCTQSPYQPSGGNNIQIGGGRGKGKGKGKGKGGGRRMRGGDGSFWNFSKLWNPSNPGQGGNILALSERGISPSGIGSPLSTAGNRPIPSIQPWPAKDLITPHEYTKGGGMQVGGGSRKHTGKHTGKGKRRSKGRGKRGGGIIDDVQMIGRDIVHKMGSVVNGFSGFDNNIYNLNPSPTLQFPRGLGNVTSGASSYSALNLKNIYDTSYKEASLK
jgi:hypothetical protein